MSRRSRFDLLHLSWVFAIGAIGCRDATGRECRDVIQHVNANVDRATNAISKLEGDAGDTTHLDDLVRVMGDVKTDMATIRVEDAALKNLVERYGAMLDRMNTAARDMRSSTLAGDAKGTEHALKDLAVAGKDEDRLVIELNTYCGSK